MKKFCHNCGKQYVLGAKFCPDCGTNLASLSAAPPAPPTTHYEQPATVFAARRDDDEDGVLAVDRMTHFSTPLRRLEVDVQKPEIPKETLGGALLAGQQMGQRPAKIERDAPYRDVSAKDFMQEFQKEAGTLRKHED